MAEPYYHVVGYSSEQGVCGTQEAAKVRYMKLVRVGGSMNKIKIY